MGNEASMEGGDGALAGELTGPEAELSRLSEEERRKLISTMAEAQARRVVYSGSSEHQPSGGRGSGGLSKSRTVDAFGEGPPPKPKPGRSPSSLSLLESRFRQEPKDPEQPRTGMFSSSFLSGVSSAVSSASIPKFSLFGDDEEDAAKQRPKSPGPQQGSSKGQGPPGQKQGAAPQGPGGKPAGTSPGPGTQQQGPKPKDSGPQQQGPAKTDKGGSGKPSGPQQGPAKAAPQPGGTAKPGGLLCPLCKTTELNLQGKDQPPNYSTCTQCKQQVCSLCGFSPPDSEGKEWLCLNCQMQRAMGGMEPPGPPMMKQPPKQGSAPPSPQRKEPPAGLPSKDEPGKKPPMLTKQQSMSDTGKGATPPPTPKQKTTGPGAQQKPTKGIEQAQPGPKSGQQPSPLQKAEQSPMGSPQPSPAKTTQKQEGGGFFGGFGLGGLTDMTKPPAETVTGKLFSGFGSSKTQGGTAPQVSDSVTGKLFSGFSGLTETPKPPVATSQATEGVSGKMFGFGSTILSSATNLIAGEEPKSPPGSLPDSPIGSGSKSTPGSPLDSASPPDTPPIYSKEPASPKPESTDENVLADKPISEAAKTEEPQTTSNCPLCKVELNVGSTDVPNYSTCTECQKTVCNHCGFNPMPHLSENEWLCLNCQTQRALSGQLGDLPPPPSPSKMPAKSQPTPPSSPARTVSSTPSTPAPTVTASPSKALIRTLSVTQAPADKSEHDSVTADAKLVVASASVKQDEESTQVVPEPNKEQTLDTACESTTLKSTTPEQTIRADVLPADIILRDIANAKETDAKQCEIIQQIEPKTQNEKGGGSEPEQHELEENDSPSNHANVIRINHDKYPSEATILDNKPEIREDGLQVTKANLKYINEAKDGITKGEFVENEYTVEIKTEDMSPPENPFVYSRRAEIDNNKIEGKYFDHREENQSEEESKVERESIAEGKVHESTQETQAPPAETPEYGNPAFPTHSELIKSELNTDHDILDEISHHNQANLTGVEELDTFSAGNSIIIIGNTEKEKIQQHEEVEDTVKLKTSNKNYPKIDEKKDAARPVEDKEILMKPKNKDSDSPSSPTSPSDLAKLESTVLPILEAQATSTKDQSQGESVITECQLELSPKDSTKLTSEEDIHRNDQEEVNDAVGPTKVRKKLLVPTELKQNFLEDSSEGESSPLIENENKPGEVKDIGRDSAGSSDKDIVETSTHEDVSPSVGENLTKQKIIDQENKLLEEDVKKDIKKNESSKARGLVKNSSINPEEEVDCKSIISVAKIEELSKGEQTLEDNGAGIRHFKTIELNTVATVRQASDDGELESLTDSPDDRSRGEGSSSLHASSFTPGTSPTSLSSLDEDSDSSSPSHIKSSGEGKQHRKAKHRQPGQMLPTIEDSSEEEELREEEELLKEQEKQKNSSKKSKKDKEEIRAQRRRERPKTPPSNLSPIEDASPTEEQRQEAEMEEFRRSSCSDFSPSMDSDPEGFEILPEKIAAVQKVYHLPTSVSLYSPTDDQHANKQSREITENQPLHTSYDAYEEIMLRTKSPTIEDSPPGKESLYGEVVTTVITEDDGKPVDLTAGRRAVCCDVVYKLPFAGSCATQQPSAPLPEDRFGYRDDHYQYDRSPYGMRGLGGIKPSMSDTNLAEAGLFLYKTEEQDDMPLNLEISISKDIFSGGQTEKAPIITTAASLDYTDASLEAIAASLEALSSPMIPGDEKYQMERELLELEKIKQQRLAEELEWERQEIQRFREQEQLLVQKELEELQVMKQQILYQQEEERQAHLMMQKETYAQQQEQLEQIQRLQEQLRQQLEEQKYRQMYPGEVHEQTLGHIVGTDKKMDSGCQTDEEDNTEKAYTAGRKKKNAKKSVDSCVQTDDEDQDEWEVPTRGRRSRPRGGKYSSGDSCGVSVQALTEISVQTDSSGALKGHSVQTDTRIDFPNSERTSPKRRPTPLEISQSPHLKTDNSCLQGKVSPSSTPTGTQKKVKRTLPNPPSEEEAANTGQTAYSTASARRRLCRSSNMARAKILQDIDRELDLVERESSKLRKKQAELDEEEKEIDAKLRYLEMGINRRKDALLKEREKRERAYLQSVAEDRDYMSDSEVSNIRETRRSDGRGEVSELGLERPHTAPQSELDEFVPPQTKYEYGKYSQYHYPQYQQSLYQAQQPFQSQSIYSSVPSLTASQQQSYHQMLLLQQKARQQAALLSELDATKVGTNYENSSYLGGKYGNHLDLHGLEDRGGSMAGSPMSNVSADSFYADLDQHHQTPRSYLLLEDATELSKSTGGLSSTSYGIAERELAKAECLLRRTAADVGTDYLGSSSRLHSYGKAQDDEDPMEEPYELKLLKQQLKQEFRRSTGGTESLEQLASLSHHYTPSTGVTSGGYRAFPKTEKYSISRLTLEKQAAKQLPTSMLYQKHKSTSNIGKYSIQDSRGLDTDYSSYLGSSSASPRSSRLLQDEITFGLRKNIAEQQKYLGSTLGVNLAGSLNLGQSLNLTSGVRSSLGEDSAYPSGSRSRPSSRPTSMYGLDLSIKRDISSSSLRLKSEGDTSSETAAYQAPSGRTKPTSLPIGQGGRGRIPIVAQNSEEESPLSPVGQPMGMARASAGPLPPISADSRDQFGSCLSLQDPQQQHLREDTTRGRSYMLIDDLQGTMSDSEGNFYFLLLGYQILPICFSLLWLASALSFPEYYSTLSESLVGLNRDDPGNTHENVTDAYHLRREETDWFDKPREDGQGLDRRQMKSQQYPFSHARIKLQRDPKDRSVSGLCNGPAGNGLGIRIIGGKEVPGNDGEIGAYVAKVLPGGAAEQSGKIVEGMQILEWNGISLSGKTYEEVQALVSQPCSEAELCVRLDLNMLSDSEGSHLDLHEQTKAEWPPRSPGVDPKQLAAELQKVSQQQAPSSTASSLTALDKSSASGASSSVPSPGQPASPSVSKKRHSKTSEAAKTQAHPITGEIQLQINYDKQLGNLIVHVLQARNLAPRDNNGYSDPFVKVYLLPGRGQVMVVQNASAENKRRSKHVQKSLNPEWNQTVIYKNIHLEQLRKKTLEVSVWDYDKCSSNDFLGEVLIDLSNTAQLDNVPHWLPLKEQCEGEHHRRSHSGQGRQHSSKTASGHSPKTSGHSNQDSPKSSVIKSRSHGIFPDPAKDTQVPTIEKSHSSPSTSKPSPSEARSHGTPRVHGKSGASRAHPEDTMATAEAASEQHRLQPTQTGCLSLRQHRHSVAGVLTIQTALSNTPGNEITDVRHLTLRKAMSEERPQRDRASRSHRSADAPVTAASLDSGLSGSAFSLLEEEGETNGVDSAIFQVPRLDTVYFHLSTDDISGKTQVMGEIKIALKKEMKTEGEHLVLEILQCRNITYKFKSPDHLPDMYVKLYVVNIATQKRIIKKKTRVCRHDREPSFNETFRFCMNPTGHSIQLFLVSNGGKFVKKTLIGEAYVWLDKVDLRKRVVSWHKLLATTAQIQS
ncbi:hypothetical protein QTP70_018329 [Hemibagrus guttatus]|uniref:Protein piccolo n=1 Tax=Hemibagrus guttatus TaxID=175788 RepID=A0AAE0UST3_9TELE|nr:hypothetical protein QTP70_018329 [Hemibagrus guttatus]